MSEQSHVAKRWVEQHFPEIPSGAFKAAMILAYGSGFDAGMQEAADEIKKLLDERGVPH